MSRTFFIYIENKCYTERSKDSAQIFVKTVFFFSRKLEDIFLLFIAHITRELNRIVRRTIFWFPFVGPSTKPRSISFWCSEKAKKGRKNFGKSLLRFVVYILLLLFSFLQMFFFQTSTASIKANSFFGRAEEEEKFLRIAGGCKNWQQS